MVFWDNYYLSTIKINVYGFLKVHAAEQYAILLSTTSSCSALHHSTKHCVVLLSTTPFCWALCHFAEHYAILLSTMNFWKYIPLSTTPSCWALWIFESAYRWALRDLAEDYEVYQLFIDFIRINEVNLGTVGNSGPKIPWAEILVSRNKYHSLSILSNFHRQLREHKHRNILLVHIQHHCSLHLLIPIDDSK